MPPFPSSTTIISRVITRATSSADLISSPNISGILSDALLSFSPLGTLVGADSARNLTHRVTNIKQSFIVSLAPIGALGMMATVCKGTNLPGLKDMLGAGEDDINDSARELGCGVLEGDAVPMLSKTGGLISTVKDNDFNHAAHAVVRLDWVLGDDKDMLDWKALLNVTRDFAGGVISARLSWHLFSQRDVEEMIREVNMRVYMMGSFPPHMLQMTHELAGGQGIIELYWPAPAMPLETNSFVIYLYGVLFAVGFLSIAILAPILRWQSTLSSALLVGGQAVLMTGHAAAIFIVKHQRNKIRIRIPRTGLGAQWTMIDKPRFTSFLVQRLFSFTTTSPNQVTLSQYRSFKHQYTVTWHAILTLIMLVSGFIAFYVGGKSSNVKTVVIYIGLFILANVTKGQVILLANKPQCTRSNHSGYTDIKERNRMEGQKTVPDLGHDSRIEIGSTSSQRVETIAALPKHAPESIISTPGSNTNGVSPQPDWTATYPNGFRIYCKFSFYNTRAIDTFYYSSSDEWVLAAHVIHNAVKHVTTLPEFGNSVELEDLLQIPLYQWRTISGGSKDSEEFCGLLLLAIDSRRKEHLFWGLGMEVVSILMDTFTSRMELCSESQHSTSISFLPAFVYTCTRMLLSEDVYCGERLISKKQRGARSLMYAIEEMTRVNKEAHHMIHVFNDLVAAAEKAKMAKGVRLMKSADLGADKDEELMVLKAEAKLTGEREWFRAKLVTGLFQDQTKHSFLPFGGQITVADPEPKAVIIPSMINDSLLIGRANDCDSLFTIVLRSAAPGNIQTLNFNISFCTNSTIHAHFVNTIFNITFHDVDRKGIHHPIKIIDLSPRAQVIESVDRESVHQHANLSFAITIPARETHAHSESRVHGRIGGTSTATWVLERSEQGPDSYNVSVMLPAANVISVKYWARALLMDGRRKTLLKLGSSEEEFERTIAKSQEVLLEFRQ